MISKWFHFADSLIHLDDHPTITGAGELIKLPMLSWIWTDVGRRLGTLQVDMGGRFLNSEVVMITTVQENSCKIWVYFSSVIMKLQSC